MHGSIGCPTRTVALKLCYWVDGEWTDIADIYGNSPPHAGIAASGGKLYITGHYNDGGISKPCYWVDGKRIDITDLLAFIVDSQATGIAVVE